MVNRIIAIITSVITVLTSVFYFFFVPKSYEYRDLAYGTDVRHTLDLNIPKENDGEVGLVLFIHGGAWFSGSKDNYDEEIEFMSDRLGYAAAAINYRYVSETVSANDIMDDIDAALSFIKQKAKEHSVDVNKVLLTGISAGAHLALLYGYSRVDTAPIKPAAVISNCAPVDLTLESFYTESETFDEPSSCFLMTRVSGKEFTSVAEMDIARDALLKISPFTYVNENTVPTIINHGKIDKTVPYRNAQILDQKLTEYGVTHIFNTYPESGHNLDGDFIIDMKADKMFVEYCETYLN